MYFDGKVFYSWVLQWVPCSGKAAPFLCSYWLWCGLLCWGPCPPPPPIPLLACALAVADLDLLDIQKNYLQWCALPQICKIELSTIL